MTSSSRRQESLHSDTSHRRQAAGTRADTAGIRRGSPLRRAQHVNRKHSPERDEICPLSGGMNQVVCEGTRTARTPAVGRALRPRKKDFARSGARFFREASHNKFPDFSVYPLHTFPICPLPPGSGLSQFPNLPASSGKRAFPISQFARFLREAGVPSSPHCPLSPGSDLSQLSNLPASSWKRAFPVFQFARFLLKAGFPSFAICPLPGKKE